MGIVMTDCRIANRQTKTKRGVASARIALAMLLSTTLAACSTLGSSGPNSREIRGAKSERINGADIRVVELTDQVAHNLIAHSKPRNFHDVLGEGQPTGAKIGQGDVLAVTVWEAPPAALFGMLGQRTEIVESTSLETAKMTDMPQQMVDASGMLSLPFVGTLRAAGKTPRQLEADIAARLRGIANKPQVSVGTLRNATSNVTVVGKVATNGRVPLTPRGERLLDVLAVSGGVTEKLERTVIQITRTSEVVSMPVEAVIRDPRQNIRLQPDDVVTAIHQPYSFTALGAVGTPSEIDFEATGITLSQALGRIGGVQDNRADVKGVFLFRLEDPRNLDPTTVDNAQLTPDGKLLVIYRVNLADPRSFFLAQNFTMRNRDILYVSNAPGVDLQKFVSIISQMAFSLIGVSNAVTAN
jgi:polysaccharide export outer membrane protein